MYLTQGEEAAFCQKEVALLLLLHPTSLMSSSSHSSTTNPLLAMTQSRPQSLSLFKHVFFHDTSLPLSPSHQDYPGASTSHIVPSRTFKPGRSMLVPLVCKRQRTVGQKHTAQVNRLQTSNPEVAKHQKVRLTAVFTSLSLDSIWLADCPGVCWRKQKS